MKLRIRGNSLRLRLTKTEVTDLAAAGCVEDRVQLDPNPDCALIYRLELSPTATQPAISFRDSQIRIVIPAKEGRAWADNDTVGIYGEETWGLKLTIEKDFKCLDPRRDEDESDAFEHPGGITHGTCTNESE